MLRGLNAPAFANIVIAEIDGPVEVRTIEELQKEVWKIPDLDVVPLTHLVAARPEGKSSYQ